MAGQGVWTERARNWKNGRHPTPNMHSISRLPYSCGAEGGMGRLRSPNLHLIGVEKGKGGEVWADWGPLWNNYLGGRC